MKDFIFVFILFSNLSYSQIIPSFQGVHSHNTTSESMSTYALDFANNDNCTNNCTGSFYGEINWSDMSEYTVSMWVKSGEDNPSEWRAFFNTSSTSRKGFQMDSGGSSNYRMHATAAGGSSPSFGANSLTTSWVHLAIVAGNSETKLYYNGDLVSTNSWIESYWDQIEIGRNRNVDRPGNYFIDEIRVWDVAVTQANIRSWMHKPISDSHPNYSDLEVYFQMNSNSISGGNTLLDISGNDNNATLYNVSGIETLSSNVPLSDLSSSYQNDVEGIWTSTGTSSSDGSDGLSMVVSPALSDQFAVFGNNNTSSTSTSGLPSGTAVRSARIWQVDKYGTVSADINFNLSEVIGANPSSVGGSSNYKLLYRVGTSGGFLVEATASAVSSAGDIASSVVTFSGVTLKDGYYAIAATQSGNL